MHFPGIPSRNKSSLRSVARQVNYLSESYGCASEGFLQMTHILISLFHVVLERCLEANKTRIWSSTTIIAPCRWTDGSGNKTASLEPILHEIVASKIHFPLVHLGWLDRTRREASIVWKRQNAGVRAKVLQKNERKITFWEPLLQVCFPRNVFAALFYSPIKHERSEPTVAWRAEQNS